MILRSSFIAWVAMLSIVVPIGTASAHEGPPFPLLLDQPLADYLVSIWADPDIGEAQFFVIVETASGGFPKPEPTVSLWTEPLNDRLEREVYVAERQSLRNHLQFYAKPYFDQRDMWRVGVRLAGADGKPLEITTEVESTPPGFGPWDLAIYLFPFVLLGGAWVIAMMRRQLALRRDAAQLLDPSLTSVAMACEPTQT